MEKRFENPLLKRPSLRRPFEWFRPKSYTAGAAGGAGSEVDDSGAGEDLVPPGPT